MMQKAPLCNNERQQLHMAEYQERQILLFTLLRVVAPLLLGLPAFLLPRTALPGSIHMLYLRETLLSTVCIFVHPTREVGEVESQSGGYCFSQSWAFCAGAPTADIRPAATR